VVQGIAQQHPWQAGRQGLRAKTCFVSPSWTVHRAPDPMSIGLSGILPDSA
jgi:hypothetical protein